MSLASNKVSNRLRCRGSIFDASNEKMCLVVDMSVASKRVSNSLTVSSYVGGLKQKGVPRRVDVPRFKESFELGCRVKLCYFRLEQTNVPRC